MIQDPFQPFYSEVLGEAHQITPKNLARIHRETRKRPMWVPTFGWVFHQLQAVQTLLVSGPSWLRTSWAAGKGRTFILLQP